MPVLVVICGCNNVAEIKSIDDPQADDQSPLLTKKIKYVVVLVKENHTFDNYFAGFPGATSSLTAKLHDGTVITRPVAPAGPLPRDLCHAHHCARTDWAGGKMDGYDRLSNNVTDGVSGEDDYLAYARYTETEIPNYWAYARTFTLADHFFATIKGPSFPGHFASVVGFTPFSDNPNRGNCDASKGPCTSCFQSPGVCTVTRFDANTCAESDRQSDCVDTTTVFDELPSNVTWAEYGPSDMLAVNHVKSLAHRPDRAMHARREADLLPQLKSGNQPNVIFAHLEAESEHPGQDVCPGENYSVRILNAIMQGPHWNETAVFLTWDDYGGWYDSVKPPSEVCHNGDSFSPGMRLPMLIISPYAKAGTVFTGKAEQASLPLFIAELYGLPKLSNKDPRNRDKVAGSLTGAFDFTQSPLPPLVLEERPCP
ncbi:MAG: alkaline phosphatase family protein [Myxococcaceae bacterium]